MPQFSGLTRPVSFSRHDQHNLEFKGAVACPAQPQTFAIDLYLFFPQSLHVEGWTRSELRQDFYSPLRLAIQQSVARQESQVRTLIIRVEGLLESFANLQFVRLNRYRPRSAPRDTWEI